MNTKKSFMLKNRGNVHMAIAFILVFIVAFSNLYSFSILQQMDVEKIEKLAEGENDIDFEEKEKNLEAEEDTFLSIYGDRLDLVKNQLHNSQYLGQLTIYHLKIPTPPPDLT